MAKFEAVSKLLIIIMLGTGLVACSSSKSPNNAEVPAPVQEPDVVPPPVIPGDGDDVDPASDGKTVTFYPDLAEFNTFVAVVPLNNPTNFKITIDLENAGQYRYAGEVSISYVDNGQQRQSHLIAETDKNEKFDGGSKDNGKLKAHYNYWYEVGGNSVFTGFFEDELGAIVLVVDEAIDEGDASGSALMSGKVYYKNFSTTFAPKSPYRPCWFIYNSYRNYDCRSDSIINKSSTVPSNGYRLLGTFRGLNPKVAFE